MGRKGVVGELLVILVLFASVGLIISTFVDKNDVPNISRYSLGQLRDMRDYLSRAILSWLDEGVSTQVLACNGVYPLDLSEQQYKDALRPYVETAIVEAQGNQISTGDLKDIEFDDTGKLTITLQNGSIIYRDANIYSEDQYDKEYLFNVRLLVALRVAQDWLRCDAGNLSQNLVDEYGSQCFFGIKDPSYPGFCANKLYSITDTDRNYMMSKAVTPATLTRATEKSVNELNRYFAGDAYCKDRVVQNDTGIQCRFELEDMSFEYEMSPFTSWYIALPYDSDQVKDTGILREALSAGDEDYRYFMRSDTHVWAVPANITSAPYPDASLGTPGISCAPEGREPVTTAFTNNIPWSSPSLVDVRSGSTSVQGRPILYVNTTRGAKFTVKVTCKDNRAALLGQPLEYTFRLRHGMRQSCGPRSWMLGTFDCGRCMPRPAPEGDKCQIPRGTVCGEPYNTLCRDSLLWKLKFQDGTLDWPNSLTTGLQVVDYLRDQGQFDVLDMLNASCNGIVGMPEYPAAQPTLTDKTVCNPPFGTVCCGMYGFNESLLQTHNINNPLGFFNEDDNTGLCLTKKSCGQSPCVDYACNSGTGECEQVGEVRSQNLCGGKCARCGPEGKCDDYLPAGTTCDASGFCRVWVCDGQGSCESKSDPAAQPGNACGDAQFRNECAPYQCTGSGDNLFCMPNKDAVPAGTPCDGGFNERQIGNQICRIARSCYSGACQDTGTPYDCRPAGGGGGGSCPAQCDNSDNKCCGSTSAGCWSAC